MTKIIYVENQLDKAIRAEITKEIKIEPYMDNRQINKKLDLMYRDNEDLFETCERV